MDMQGCMCMLGGVYGTERWRQMYIMKQEACQ